MNRSLVVTMFFAMTLLIQSSFAADEQFVGLFTDGKNVSQLKCVQADEKQQCQTYRFREIKKLDGSVIFESDIVSKESAQESIKRALHAYRVLPRASLLVVGTGITALACVATHLTKKGRGICATIPLGVAVDVIKAPMVLNYLAFEGSFRGVKKVLLAKRLNKVLKNGKVVKVTKVTDHTYRTMNSFLFQ